MLPLSLRCLLLCTLLLPISLWSQPAVWSASGAARAATARAQAGVSGDLWSLFGNPAGIVGIGSMAFGTHIEQRFALQELSAAQGGMVIPISERQTIGAKISWFGLGEFGEGRYGISYSIQPLEGVRIGTSLNAYQMVIPSQGTGRSLYLDAGVQVEATDRFTIGAFAVNLNRAEIQRLGEGSPLPAMIQAGLAFEASDQVLLLADVAQEIDGPLSLKAGLEYQPADILYIRAGFQTAPSAVSGGLGLNLQQLRLDLAVSYQPLLGFVPHLSLTYQLAGDEE